MYRRLILITLLSTTGLFAANYQCQPAPKVATLLKQRKTYPTSNESLVYLRMGCPAGCSGSIIAKDLVLTAAHCVADGPYAFVMFSDGSMDVGVAIKVGHWQGNVAEDWALIRTDTGKRKTLKLACQNPTPGSRGTDLTCGGENWPNQQTYPVTFGQVKDEVEFNTPYLSLNGPVDHGDSGSALLNAEGGVVGVVSELSWEDPKLGMAVPLSSLYRALGPFIKVCPSR